MLMARLESMSQDFNSKVEALSTKVDNIPVGGGGQVVVRVSYFFSFVLILFQH